MRRRLTICRHPELISHVFSVCTPYSAPQTEYYSTEQIAKGPLPQFGYQVHLASGEVEESVEGEQSIRQFLKGMWGGKGPNGELVFDPYKGVLVENIPLIGDSRLLSGKVSVLRVHGITLQWSCGQSDHFLHTRSSLKKRKLDIAPPDHHNTMCEQCDDLKPFILVR